MTAGGAALPDVVGGLDRTTLSPAARRVVDDLLDVAGVRPPVDVDLPRRLRDLLEGRLAPVVEQRPADARRVTLGKTQLDALACDGRYTDLLDSPFEWSRPTVRGQLVHRGIALDHVTTRATPVADLMAHAWEEFAHTSDDALDFTARQSDLEAASLQAEAGTLVEEYRATFPSLPETWRIVFEPTLVARLAAGQVVVRGKPDIVLGRPAPDRRRMLLIDLKTGNRSRTDRQDMRLYALLATLKYRQAPFKTATFYLDEGTWDEEPVTEDVLEAAARQLLDRAGAAVRLADDPTPVHVVAGPMCDWCGRAPTCEVRAEAARAATAPGGP